MRDWTPEIQHQAEINAGMHQNGAELEDGNEYCTECNEVLTGDNIVDIELIKGKVPAQAEEMCEECFTAFWCSEEEPLDPEEIRMRDVDEAWAREHK